MPIETMAEIQRPYPKGVLDMHHMDMTFRRSSGIHGNRIQMTKWLILIFFFISPVCHAQSAAIDWTNVHQVIDGFGAADINVRIGGRDLVDILAGRILLRNRDRGCWPIDLACYASKRGLLRCRQLHHREHVMRWLVCFGHFVCSFLWRSYLCDTLVATSRVHYERQR